MPINKALKRYQWREKHRKQYTFTKTKLIIGFIISVTTSVVLGSYFEKYGKVAFTEGIDIVGNLVLDYIQSPHKTK